MKRMSLGTRRFLLCGLGVALIALVLDAGPILYALSLPAGRVRLGLAVFITFWVVMAFQCSAAWLIARRCKPQWQWGLVGFAMKVWLIAFAGVVVALAVRADPLKALVILLLVAFWESFQAMWVWVAAYVGANFRGGAGAPTDPAQQR